MRGGDFTLKRIDTDKLLAVGVALSKEKDRDLLLETILTAAMDFTDCDGGTLYTTADDTLVFHTMITKSLDIRRNRKDGLIDLPPRAAVAGERMRPRRHRRKADQSARRIPQRAL
jgi:hypothetical protein